MRTTRLLNPVALNSNGVITPELDTAQQLATDLSIEHRSTAIRQGEDLCCYL